MNTSRHGTTPFDTTPPPPVRSKRIYIRLAPKDVSRFRFVLESYDNSALMSVLDKYEAAARILFPPEGEAEVLEILAQTSDIIDFTVVPFP